MELLADKSDAGTTGFLFSLLGDGCECHKYNIEIVGHSVGGSVAALGVRVSLFSTYRENISNQLMVSICHNQLETGVILPSGP
jgi:hypothetical protein